MSAISSACSPVSGWDTSSSLMSTPSALAYCGSSACSASMNAAMPPGFCASATACSATVVLPETLRAVDLDDAAAGHPADPEREVQRQGAGRDGADVDGRGVAELHQRALAELLLDVGEGEVEGLVAVHGAPGSCSSTPRRPGSTTRHELTEVAWIVRFEDGREEERRTSRRTPSTAPTTTRSSSRTTTSASPRRRRPRRRCG
jgi:hypothetical protein